MAQESRVILIPQDYAALNFGGVLAPSGNRGAAQLAALLATPHMGYMHVHSVPTFYTQPKRPAQNGGNVSLAALMGGL
jgi:hypothetical protein